MPHLLRTFAVTTLLFFTPYLLSDALGLCPQTDPSSEQVHPAAGVFDGVSLLDQAGNRFTAGRVDGDIVILNFIFTECGTSCPVQTDALAAVQRDLPPEIRKHVSFVSITVDPANDTAPRLKQFAEAHHLDQAKWAFVTGEPDAVGRFIRRFDVFEANPSNAKTGFHTTDIRLIDSHGHVMQRYSGAPLDRARLLREIEWLANRG